MLKLLHTKNETVLSEYDLKDGITHIGRGPGNEIRIEDMSVSANHAIIIINPNKYMKNIKDIIIKDQSSTNGTYLNDTKIKTSILRHGDTIRIGALEFKLVNDNEVPLDSTRIFLPE